MAIDKIETNSLSTDIELPGNKGSKMPTGTTAERNASAEAGEIRFNSSISLMEYYNGTSWKSIDSPPTVSSIDVSEVDSGAGGNQTIVITGNGFASGATVTFVGASGADFNASTVTVNSTTQITAVAPQSSFLNAQEPYGVKVTNASNLSATLSSQINVDSAPTFDVASGSLGTLANSNRASSNLTAVAATDADGDTITFSQISGTLPTGITFNANGTFSGTANAETSDTTYTFTIRATANSKTSDRQYTITVEAPTVVVYSYTGSTQTFTVPAGVTSIQAKVWGAAGAGHDQYYSQSGGAGGFGIGTINVTGISSLNIVVGQGGQKRTIVSPNVGASNMIATYGHLTSASTGQNGGWGNVAGTGGGLSGIFNGVVTSQSNAIVIAGGGGAAGSVSGEGQSVGQGGYGGGFNQNGGSGGVNASASHGRPGTTSAGGDNGTVHFTRNASSGYTTANGGALHGGHGNTQTDGSSEGGGGGSGYFGGGAGTHGSGGGTWASGAGGSGYANTSLVSSITAANAGSAGSANSSAEADSNWASGIGSPVAGDNNGGNGRVVIIY